MTRRNLFGIALAAALAFALSHPAAADAQAKNADTIKIGMVKNFFNDLPDALVAIVTEPFGTLMKNTTGLDGALTYNKGAFDTAGLLNDDKLHFAVFQGHEFAWVRKAYPKLKPVAVAVNAFDDIRCFVIVSQKNPATSIKDLRGKTLDMPLLTKQHCWAYIERHCTDNAQPDPKAFFGKIVKSESPLVGMDDVCRGKIDAVIVDALDLKFYREQKPAVFSKNLRILQQSDRFPHAVIVYKDGAVKDMTLKQFRAGLLKAHTIDENKDLFDLWKLRSFEAPPANFDAVLDASLKAYPPPSSPVSVGAR